MKSIPKTNLLFALAMLAASVAFAQSSFFENRPIAQDTLPVFPVFSGLSPLLVPAGQVEILFFNALSTQKNQRLPVTDPGDISRGTALQHIVQVTFGTSATGRFNLGADIHYLHYRLDGNVKNSPLKVLKSNASDTLVTDPENKDILAFGFHTLSRVGLRFRWVPSLDLPELTLQGGLLFPMSYQPPAIKRALDIARTQFWVQGNFYHLFSEGLYGFGSAGVFLSVPSETQHQTTFTPLANVTVAKVIPGDLLILFAQTSFNASFNKQYKAGLLNTSSQWLYGIGAQLQFSSNLSVSAQFQKPFINNYNNLSSEPVAGSLSNLSLNVRYITGK